MEIDFEKNQIVVSILLVDLLGVYQFLYSILKTMVYTGYSLYSELINNIEC